MAWATGSRRKFARTAAATVVGLGIIVVALWQYPGAELVLFHVVWLCLAVVAFRTPSDRIHIWTFVGFVGGLAVLVEIDDLRTRFELADTVAELGVDLLAFVALVILARRNHDLLAVERQLTDAEHRRNDRQRRFFANTAHAQRTPITIARGHIELAMQSIDDPMVRDDLAAALDELDTLHRGTDRSLRLAVAGELDPRRVAPVDVNDLARWSLDRWKPAAQREWVASIDGLPCEVMGDREQLAEALDALIENALLATTSGDTITVGCRCADQTIELSVADTGCGIDVADPDQLFEPFEKGPPTNGRKRGTGLGLAVVRAVAQAHGGDARIESSPGHGTTVTIVIPQAESNVAQHTEILSPSH